MLIDPSLLPERIIYKPDAKIDKAILRTGGIGDCVWLLPTIRALAKKGHSLSVHVRRESAPVFFNNPYISVLNMYDSFEGKPTNSMFFDVEMDAEIMWFDRLVESFLEFDNDKHPNMGCISHRYFIPLCGDCVAGQQQRMDRVRGINFSEIYLTAAGCAGEDPSYINEMYFTEEEHRLLKAETADWEDKYVVLWLLAHQHYHTYMRFVEVIQEFTDSNPDAIVYVTGYEHLLKDITSASPQIRVGNWPLRTTLGLLGYANLIVGSATGIMNAAGAFDTPKICMLSTVFPEQFGKHWKNAYWIDSGVPCSPCHQVHATWKTCPTIDSWPICTAGDYNALLLTRMDTCKADSKGFEPL